MLLSETVSSLMELYYLIFHAGMPASAYSPEEIEAAKAELDRKLIELGDAARKLAEAVNRAVQSGTPLPPALIRKLEEDPKDTERRFHWLREQRDFLADYLTIFSQRDVALRQAAAERIAGRMENAGPFAPHAREALKRAASIQNKDWKELLRETVVAATWLVALQGEKPERIREGQKWAKDRDGEVAEVIPARQYGPASPEFQHWFELRVRTLVEHEILELAHEQPTESRNVGYTAIEDHEIAGALGSPDPVLSSLLKELTSEDRALLERADQGVVLGDRDRKRLERLRKKTIPKIF